MGVVLVLAAALAAPVPAAAPPLVDADLYACTALRALDFSDAVGAEVRLDEPALLPAAGDQPALCRATGTIAPQVGFEVRMPVERWNSRLLVTGCSNLCGVLQVQGMEDALARGYATATTDLGHRTGDPTDARWAWNNPALEADFGHRATHVTALAAKALVAGYYGERPAWSYFRGCSTGGRQGLVAAQRYPGDFDGIIAGAPFDPSRSVPHMAWILAANTGPGGAPVLGEPQFALLGAGVLAACDANDGLKDGIISDPLGCRFDPGSLACGAGQAGNCLTPAQVEAATKIYAGPPFARSPDLPQAGAPPGSESSWAGALLAPPGKPAFFAFIVDNWSRYLAYDPDPPEGGPVPAFDFDTGPRRIATAAAVAGFSPELARFRTLGGKLILYHGAVDESLMPAHTLAYWQAAERRFGAQPLADFARFFLVPGMRHCGGGPGATEVDWLTALERWVEQDEAPARLLAYKLRGARRSDERQTRFPPAPASVERVRPVYPYPEVTIYKGEGDPARADSFQARGPAPPPPAPQ